MRIFRSKMKRNYKHSEAVILVFFNRHKLFNSLTFVFSLDRILENRYTTALPPVYTMSPAATAATFQATVDETW